MFLSSHFARVKRLHDTFRHSSIDTVYAPCGFTKGDEDGKNKKLVIYGEDSGRYFWVDDSKPKLNSMNKELKGNLK